MSFAKRCIGYWKKWPRDATPFPSPEDGAGGRADRLIPWALFLQGVLALSPIPPVVGVRGMYLYGLVYLVSVYQLICNHKTIPRSCVYLCLVVFCGSCLSGLHWESPKLAFVSLFFIGSVLITGIADRTAVNTFITLCTYFFMGLLALCWIGFIYVLNGGQGLFSIANYDGRENVFYLTTFSNYIIENTIRPAGIFDEPGSLSFLVCATAALRMLYGRNNFISILLLQLGVVVFGFTHYIFFVLFILCMRDKTIKQLAGVLSVVVLINIGLHYALQGPLEKLFLWKLAYVPESKTLYGDNRSAQVILANSRLTLSTFLWGLDPTGVIDVNAFRNRFGKMAENPLGPLTTAGIFVSFPYYYVMLRFVLRGLSSRRDHIYLAVAALFIPRPFITGFGFSVMAMLLFLSMQGGPWIAFPGLQRIRAWTTRDRP